LIAAPSPLNKRIVCSKSSAESSINPSPKMWPGEAA
jgi:hypothetical protein